MNNTKTKKQVIVSGDAHGSGKDRYRWVSRLSKEAKTAIENETALVICERPFDDIYGEWYVVEGSGKRSTWNHRLPTEEEATLIKEAVL